MQEFLEGLTNLINDWAPLIYAFVTACAGVFLKARDAALKKKSDYDAKQTAKNESLYNLWVHEESQRVIRKVKDLCNYYKDKGHIDSVSYVQLENGTVATSKLCNMFVSCLAEDDRFGNLPKYISKFQRVPYSRISYWLEKIQELEKESNDNNEILTYDSESLGANATIREILDSELINSSIIAPVYDPNKVLLGVAVFLYADKNFNDTDLTQQRNMMHGFKVSLESIFLDYYISRQEKRKELNILGGDY